MELLINLLPLVVLGGLAYLLLIRPQKRRQQQQVELQRSLEPGTAIMTTAGILATVIAVTPDEVSLEVSPGVVIRVVPAAIAKVVPPVVPDPSDAENAQ